MGLTKTSLARVLCGLSTAVAALTAPVLAAGGPTGPGADAGAAGRFQAMQTAAFSSLFTTCQGSTIGNALGSAAACFNAPPGDLKEVSKNLTCEAFQSSGQSSGSFSFELAKKRMTQFEEMLKGTDCEKAKLDSARGQLQCLTDQAGALAKQIGALASEFKDNISRARNDIDQINSQIIDRKAQQKDLVEKIGGDGEVGDDGLLGAKKETEALVAKIQGDLLRVKNDNRALDNQRKQLIEQVQSRTVVLAKECFETKSEANYRCEKNGAPKTLKEYVLCRYEQNQHITDKGVVEDSALNKARSGGNRAALEQLLNKLFSEAPKNKDIPMSQEQLQAMATQSVGVLSFADLSKSYASRLAQFNGKGLDISSFILKNAEACFNKAEATVKRERQLKSSQLGTAQEAILAKERENQANSMSKFQEYNQVYTKAVGAITSQNLPLVLTACENAKPAQQEGCFDQIEKSVRGLLMGNAPGTTVQMEIKGTNPQNNIRFTCAGLNGCLKDLQTRNKAIKTEIAKVKDFKRSYVTKVNDGIETFAQRMAQVMSTQNQALDQQMRTLNGTLASLGVKGVIDLKPIEQEELEKDGEVGGDNDSDMGGLYKMPKNLLKTVGGRMSPPMLNVAENSFKDALEGIAERKEKLEDRKTQAQEGLDKVAALMSECPAREKEKAVDKINNLMGQIHSCTRDEDFCGGNGQAELERLLQSVKQMELSGDDPDISGSLSRGIARCKKLEQVKGQGQVGSTKVTLVGESSSDCMAVVTSLEARANDVSRINKRVQRASKSSSAQ